tara:strand:+ start:238 stop:897 length:660 start_codon:yes stop_codon:yes gene_type:complete
MASDGADMRAWLRGAGINPQDLEEVVRRLEDIHIFTPLDLVVRDLSTSELLYVTPNGALPFLIEEAIIKERGAGVPVEQADELEPWMLWLLLIGMACLLLGLVISADFGRIVADMTVAGLLIFACYWLFKGAFWLLAPAASWVKDNIGWIVGYYFLACLCVAVVVAVAVAAVLGFALVLPFAIPIILVASCCGACMDDRVWVQGHYRRRPRRNDDCVIL